MSLQLPDTFYSPEHIGQAIQTIEVLLGKLRDQTTQQHVGGNVVTQITSIPEPLRSLLETRTAGSENSETLEALRQELIQYRDSAPVVRLTLANWPSEVTKQRLIRWFRGVRPEVLLTFTVRTDICGGVIVQTGSRRYDLSYRELLLQNRHKIAELAHGG